MLKIALISYSPVPWEVVSAANCPFGTEIALLILNLFRGRAFMAATKSRKSHVKPTPIKKTVKPVKETPFFQPTKRIQTAEGWKRMMIRNRSGTRAK